MPHDFPGRAHGAGAIPPDHPGRADDDKPLDRWQRMEIAVRELLVEKGYLTPAEIAAQIEAMDARSPANGAAAVARAWVDPGFRARFLEDAGAASREMGFDIGPLRLVALENTDRVHNIVVCTLCSCYPRNLLGLPPDWYKTREYRSRTVREPRAVLREFGVELPENTTIRVHDSTAEMRYIVLPARPPGTEGMAEAELAALVTRDSMIGAGLPRAPDDRDVARARDSDATLPDSTPTP